MVRKALFSDIKFLSRGLEVDRDFSKIARPMTHLLEKETPFVFSEELYRFFNTLPLKRKLTEAPILIAPDWDLPFELMCDASDFAIGAVLGQRKNKHFQPIHYASKTMNEAQTHYTTTEKELLAVVYAFEKFRNLTLEFETNKGAGNLAAISVRLENPHQDKLENKEINEAFPLETLGSIALQDQSTPWWIRVVFLDKKALDISKLATVDYWGTLWCNYHSQEKSSIQDFYGPPSTRMPMDFVTRCDTLSRQEKYATHVALPIELEHKAYWALKHTNFDVQTAGDHRKVQLNELNELRDQAYENSLIYKEKTKRIHDAKIKNPTFSTLVFVSFFNSRLSIFKGKLKSRWSGPFTVVQVFPYGTVELSQNSGPNFKVNGHRIKHYFGGDIPTEVVPDLQTFP
ncbi:reverse transcriptase domain-containing protein [Tanacetum coccineum]